MLEMLRTQIREIASDLGFGSTSPFATLRCFVVSTFFSLWEVELGHSPLVSSGTRLRPWTPLLVRLERGTRRGSPNIVDIVFRV